MLTATCTRGLGVPIDLTVWIKTPADGLKLLQSFQRFLQEIPPATPVMITTQAADENLQYKYNSTENTAWISPAYLAAINKATSFVAIGEFTTLASTPTTLGTATQVLEALAPLILQLEIAAAEKPKKLYSRKVVIGVAVASGLLAAVGSFVVGWVRKDEPSSVIYPGSY